MLILLRKGIIVMRRVVRAHPVLCYYLLALAICSSVVAVQVVYGAAWQQRTGQPFQYNEGLWKLLLQFGGGKMYANLVSIAWSAAHMPIYFGVFFFGGAPTISAVTINAIGWGRPGLARLFGRLKPWASPDFRRDALVVYAAVAALMFGMTLLHLAIVYAYQGQAEMLSAASVWGLPAWLLPLPFLVGGLIDEGGTPEELGWRGFALPVMMDKIRTPIVAALFLGFLWWLWHFPREIPDIMAGATKWAEFVPDQLIFMGLVIAMTITMTYAFHRTGSVLPSILIHGWGNFATKAVGVYTLTHFDDRTWMFAIVAVGLVVFTRTRLGRDLYLQRRARMGRTSELPLLPPASA
jgi:membrane protease YdiL (CAAX protease family)